MVIPLCASGYPNSTKAPDTGGLGDAKPVIVKKDKVFTNIYTADFLLSKQVIASTYSVPRGMTESIDST